MWHGLQAFPLYVVLAVLQLIVADKIVLLIIEYRDENI